jgi:hypothetical protein
MYMSGKALVELLGEQLGPHMQWTEAERVTLGLIESARDRQVVFQSRFDELVADPKASTSRLVALSAELRLLDMTIHKWIASLDPQDNQAKSLRHVHAANARWHPNRGS